MLKRSAWAYPLFADIRCSVTGSTCDGLDLKIKTTAAGWVIDGTRLKGRAAGDVRVNINIETDARDVCRQVLGAPPPASIRCGIRVLCKESKRRGVYWAAADQTVAVSMNLADIRGVAELMPFFSSTAPLKAINGVAIDAGSFLGLAESPVYLTVDEEWTGDTIPVEWVDFDKYGLPAKAFFFVEAKSGSITPRLLLNSSHRAQVEPVLLRTGEGSASSVAGAALRELIWVEVWTTVIPWAIREASEEGENWPATRIRDYWAERFGEFGWSLPPSDMIDTTSTADLQARIQHCIETSNRLSGVSRLNRFGSTGAPS